jgi:hypothetical protein
MFPHYLDALKQGYLWFSDVLSLNDKSDSIVYYGGEKESKEFQDYYNANEPEVLLELLERYFPNKDITESLKILPKNTLIEMIGIMKNNDCEIRKYLVSKGETTENINKYFELYNLVNQSFIKKQEELKINIKPLIDFNNSLRKKLKIFSMSESHDIPSMWGTYADGNEGFCIEYDFNKSADKYLTDNLRKVKYLEKREALSSIDIFKGLIYNTNPTEDISKMFEVQLLMKDSSWQYEKEWRVVLGDCENKYYAELVTAIYIDESIEKSKEAKELIDLAKIKGWNVFIRRLSRDHFLFNYDQLV